MSYYVNVWESDGEVFYGKRPPRVYSGPHFILRGPITLIYRIKVTPKEQS